MARYVFRLPDVGEGTAEAELVAWHVQVGDQVDEDQALADVMTDKATVEVPSPVAGRVVALNGEIGKMSPVGGPLVELEVDGVDDALAAPSSSPAGLAAAPTRPAAAKTKPTSAPAPAPAGERVLPAPPSRTPGARPLAAPALRQRALDLGVDLRLVPGSGPGGRIGHADLDDFIAGAGRPAAGAVQGPNTDETEVPVIGLRRRIAQQMQEAKRRIPHFSYIEEIDVTELEALRQAVNETRKPDQPKLTLLPFLIRALIRTLPSFPQMNARFDDEAGIVRRYGGVHLGVATQTPGGLMVPVIRHAEVHGLWGLATEIARLAEAARSGSAKREELSGSTITITSLGPLGGLAHTPVINHPEVAIIGPNRMIERPVFRDGLVVPRKLMNLSSSFDHRVVDGWDAAQFVQQIRGQLEQPALLFLDRP